MKVPVLMLNGRFDFFYPTATSQEPMFKLLGTPAEHKHRVVYDSSRRIPRNETIKEVVGWISRTAPQRDSLNHHWQLGGPNRRTCSGRTGDAVARDR